MYPHFRPFVLGIKNTRVLLIAKTAKFRFVKNVRVVKMNIKTQFNINRSFIKGERSK